MIAALFLVPALCFATGFAAGWFADYLSDRTHR